MAYENIVSVPSGATSGQIPVANGSGGFAWNDPTVPTNTSDLTNDGDGESAFATQDFVDDSIFAFYASHLHQLYVPVEYRRLNSLISRSRTTYIDTGLTLDSDYHYVVEGNTGSDTDGSAIFLDSNNPDGGKIRCGGIIYNRGNPRMQRWWVGVDSGDFYIPGLDFTSRFVLEQSSHSIEITQGSVLAKQTYNGTTGYTDTNLSLWMFSSPRASFVPAYTEIYSAKILKNDIPVRDFVPVQRKADGALGMYDLVGHTFYTNAGTGSDFEYTYANSWNVCYTETLTISASDWSSQIAVKTIPSVGATDSIICTPSPASYQAAMESGVYCSAQGNGTLTFTALNSTPAGSIVMNLMIFD